MSLDGVDDLHCAEDEIGELRHELALIIGRFDAGGPTFRWITAPLLGDAIAHARGILATRYCRPSCNGVLPPESDEVQDGDDEFCSDVCGCPCHSTRP